VNILHLDDTIMWRGGQQQAWLLHRGLIRRGVHSVIAAPPESEMARRCAKDDLPFLPLDIRGEADLRAVFRLRRIAVRQGITICHAHTAHALSAALGLRMIHPAVRLIASRRVVFRVRKPLIGAIKYNNRFVDRVVCVSDAIRRLLTDDGVTPGKCVTIHSGIDPDRFKTENPGDLRSRLGIPSRHLVAGTVAALTGEKDYPTLLRSAAAVISRMPDVTFVAVGDGPEAERIRALADSLHLKKRFLFTGYRPDVGRYLNLFDCFVLTCRREGLGTSLLDAQAWGLPVVATRTGGIPEIVEDGVTGFLVPPGSPGETADALLRILRNPALRRSMGDAARRHVLRFTADRMVEQTLALYRSLSEPGCGDVREAEGRIV